MSTLYGERALDDVRAAGHGLLDDPEAVFGLGDDVFAEPPGWLAAPAEIRRRAAAKPTDDGVDATHWPGVAELARRCTKVADDLSDDGAAPAGVVHRALTLSTALARRLPQPPRSLVDVGEFPPPPTELLEDRLARAGTPSTTDDGWPARPGERVRTGLGVGVGQYYLLGYWQDRLREQACRLADTIDDRWWTDPDALAGLVDDTRRILAAYLVTMLELDRHPLPPPRRPTTSTRRTVRRPTRSGPPGVPGRHIIRHPGA